jgi:flagellar M-ring protein FliF
VTAPLRADPDEGPSSGGLLLRLQARLKEVLAGFSHGQKAVVVVAVLAVCIGGYLFMSWAGKPSYTPLFSNLSSSDAAAITQKLAANKVPYELAEDGQQVLVPQGDVYQQRLDMAAAGLPSSGDQGYSLLDNAGVTTSEFQQQVEYQQAVSDELEKTIESIDGVSSALVNVVIPQQSLFSTDADQPTASVLVSLDAGASLSAEQVQAVVHLVASSIEGLSPDDVTVVDGNGDVLNAPGTDSADVAAGTLQEQQTEAYELDLDNSLQDMLANVLGPGNAVVHTTAQLDYDQSQTTSQIYDPNKQGPIPVQQATSSESYSGAGASAAAGGILGATTLPSTPTTTAAVGKAGSKTTTTSTATSTSVPSYVQSGSSQQNVVSEVTKTVDSAPGALERLSIAVIVDSSVKGVNAGQIKQLVSAAAGLQPARGDTIQVGFLAFDQSAAKAEAAELKAAAKAQAQAKMMGEARDALVVLVVLGLLVFAMRRVTKTTRVPLALPAGYEPLELEPGDEYEEEGATLALSAPPVHPPAPPPLQAEVNQIGEMIEREPERIAEMLRAWLEAGPGEK